MVVRFEKCELKIDQIHKEEFSKEFFAAHEIKVIELIQNWKSKASHFTFKTSGSTGVAKTISIDTNRIAYSCETTMQKLDPKCQFKTSLLCLSPEMIGGAMVVFRALHRELDLTIVPPSSNPLHYLNADANFDLVSLVPLQLYDNPKLASHFHTVLVGGGHFDGPIETNAKVYQTFGMTETVSHFALRELSQETYECLGDMEVTQSEDQRLEIAGTLTNHKKLITNDLIDFISSKKFKWVGRMDFVINTGGFKVNPESVERQIQLSENRTFLVGSLPDQRLGNKLILLIEGKESPLSVDYGKIKKHEVPKEIHFIESFSYTQSGKIDRLKTNSLLQAKLKKQIT